MGRQPIVPCPNRHGIVSPVAEPSQDSSQEGVVFLVEAPRSSDAQVLRDV